MPMLAKARRAIRAAESALSKRLGRERRGATDSGAASTPRASAWAILFALTLVTFLLLLDETAVAVALPTIQDELGLGFGSMEWAVNGYTLTIAAFTLIAGRLADRNGARRIYLLGLAVFIGASLIVGLAPNAAMLIAFRAVQGLGAGLVAPAALSLITTAFPEERRGTALGVWAGASATALGIGPLVGALITETLGWQWIFLINVPVGVIALLVSRRLLPKTRTAARKIALDVVGAVLSAIGLLSLILMLSRANTAGWTSPLVVGLGALAVTSFAVFILRERRTPEPLVNLALFTNRHFAGANLVTLLSTAVMCSLFFFLALYLQSVLGYSALVSGLSLLPLTVTIVVIAPLTGRLALRWGAHRLIAGGMLLLAASLVGLSTLGLRPNIVVVMSWLALSGLGIALARTPTATIALNSAAGSGSGVAAGLLNTFQATGLALGIAVMGLILTANGPNAAFDRTAAQKADQFVQGFSAGLMVNAVIAVATAIVGFILLRPFPSSAPRKHATPRQSGPTLVP